jgi:hypothetical protein
MERCAQLLTELESIDEALRAVPDGLYFMHGSFGGAMAPPYDVRTAIGRFVFWSIARARVCVLCDILTAI